MNYRNLYPAYMKLMKVFFMLSVTFMFLWGCSSSESTISQQNMQVVHSTYESWSNPPSAGTEVPEKGTDLTVAIENWPKEYTPRYIVFNKRETLTAVIEERKNNNKVVISGRIIRMSGLMKERSEEVEISDRLVFTKPDGETGFIEIKDWKQVD